MTLSEPGLDGLTSTAATRGAFRYALTLRRGRIGAAAATAVLIVAAIGPLLAPHSATAFVTGTFQPSTSAAALGGDTLGRDVLSRVLHGGWELLLIAAAATAIGVSVGALVGLLAAYYGRWQDSVAMRAMDTLLAFPQLVLVLLLVSVAGSHVWLIGIAVALTHVPQVARVMRSATLDVAERDFVKSYELLGIPGYRTVLSEVLPNVASPLLVETGLRLTYSITIISGISFLGFGLQPPAANWGLMIQENRIGITSNPLAVVVPVTLIAILTIGMNSFVDALSTALATPTARRRVPQRRAISKDPHE